MEVDPITTEEVEVELKKLKNRKATSLDGIKSEFLKYGKDLTETLLILLNKCWRECRVSESWLQGKVILLFKKRQRNCCENYKVISLLNTHYKLSILNSRILNQRFKTISDALLLEEHSGFRVG